VHLVLTCKNPAIGLKQEQLNVVMSLHNGSIEFRIHCYSLYSLRFTVFSTDNSLRKMSTGKRLQLPNQLTYKDKLSLIWMDSLCIFCPRSPHNEWEDMGSSDFVFAY
jgi:hypothetical protein